MDKAAIQKALCENHSAFIKHVNGLSDSAFLFSNDGKWTAGQQTDHIIKSVTPVNTVFSFPKFLIKTLFGKANRDSKTYEALVQKYLLKLSEGGRASARFVPPPIQLIQRDKLLKRLSKLIESLSKQIGFFSERQLDQLLLPHPLMGKLTLREMLYFTIYHVTHHEKQIKENLKNAQAQP